MALSRNQVLKFAGDIESSTCVRTYSQSSRLSWRFIGVDKYTGLGELCDQPLNKAFPCESAVNLLISCAHAKAHLSAQKEEARPHSRVPCSLRYPNRTCGSSPSPPQRSRKAHCLMIPKEMRLSRAHFAPSGPEIRVVSTHFSLSLRKSPGQGGCAVIVSKKVGKLSVSRHLLKRRTQSVIKDSCSEDRALIVYARPGATTLPYQELKKELSELLTRALSKEA